MSNHTQERDHLLSNKLYDKLKFLAQIFLPALGTLYFGLASIWGLPAAEQVVGSITVIVTFLGVTLRISTVSYANSDSKFDGTIDILPRANGKKTFSLNFQGDPERIIEDSESVTFRVNQTS